MSHTFSNICQFTAVLLINLQPTTKTNIIRKHSFDHSQ